MRKISLAFALIASLFALPAHADFTAKDAALATITFKNPGVCTSVVCVPVFQLYDGTNVVTLTTAGADAVSNTLTGLPVYSRNVLFNGTTWDRWLGDATNGGFVNVKTSVLPTGAATAALQSSAAAAKGEGATGAAVPSGAQYVGLNSGGNLLGWAAKAGNTYAATDVVPGVAVVNTQVSVTPGDGITTTIYGTAPASPVIGVPLLWNGTTYDRWKSAGATGVAAVRQSDGTNVAQINPCQSEVQTTVPFTLATAAVKVAITGVSAKKIYVCAYDLNNNAADSVAIFEATTATTCATAAVAVIGAGTSVATAATGYNWSANGGVSRGAGGFQVMQTSVNANDLCIAQSAATQLSGTFTYVTR